MSTDAVIETNTHQLVAFTLGDEEYGIPITLVQEIIRFTSPRPIPGSSGHVEGVINLRGRIVPVVVSTALSTNAKMPSLAAPPLTGSASTGTGPPR